MNGLKTEEKRFNIEVANTQNEGRKNEEYIPEEKKEEPKKEEQAQVKEEEKENKENAKPNQETAKPVNNTNTTKPVEKKPVVSRPVEQPKLEHKPAPVAAKPVETPKPVEKPKPVKLTPENDLSASDLQKYKRFRSLTEAQDYAKTKSKELNGPNYGAQSGWLTGKSGEVYRYYYGWVNTGSGFSYYNN